jgi:cyclic beta-1,2-glucan synthetase
MAQAALARLVPEASVALLRILDGTRGPAQAPVRSEIFGPNALHSMAAASVNPPCRTRRLAFGHLLSALRNNIRALREAHLYIGQQASSGYDISPPVNGCSTTST